MCIYSGDVSVLTANNFTAIQSACMLGEKSIKHNSSLPFSVSFWPFSISTCPAFCFHHAGSRSANPISGKASASSKSQARRLHLHLHTPPPPLFFPFFLAHTALHVVVSFFFSAFISPACFHLRHSLSSWSESAHLCLYYYCCCCSCDSVQQWCLSIVSNPHSLTHPVCVSSTVSHLYFFTVSNCSYFIFLWGSVRFPFSFVVKIVFMHISGSRFFT